MLAYVLAIVIAIGSFSFYMAAFFVPEIHRRQDFVWSGVGMFYAVVLWFCAGRITGAVLLGQIASVALLGWLGWQTLALRRALTPKSVRTPVSSEDLQHWAQTAQKQLSQYLKMGSLLTGLKAIWADVGRAIDDMSDRVAGPKGQARSRSSVPPLRRSPAYEFETETGQGESVPSEFATVPTRTRTQATSSSIPENTEPSQPPKATPTAPASEAPASETDTPPAVPDPIPNSLSEAATGSQAETDKPVEATIADGAQADVVEAGKVNAARSGQAETAQATTNKDAEIPPSPKVSASAAAKSSSTKSNKLVILKDWFGDLLQSFRKPKPERTVIEIPRRPPSIPRSSDKSDKADTSKTPKSSSKRAVIDMPPRPPSIPRPPKPAQADAVTESATSETNWVDVGDDDQNWPTESPESTPLTEKSQDKPVEVDSPSNQAAASPPPATPLDEDEPETNWPDEVTDGTASQNWSIDDDSETNWPDG